MKKWNGPTTVMNVYKRVFSLITVIANPLFMLIRVDVNRRWFVIRVHCHPACLALHANGFNSTSRNHRHGKLQFNYLQCDTEYFRTLQEIKHRILHVQTKNV